MGKVNSFSLLGAELVRLAGKQNVVNANGESVHSGLFRDALKTQPNIRRNVSKFIMSPIVADEYMSYLRLARPWGVAEKDHNRYGDVEFIIAGWFPSDAIILTSPGGVMFRPFSEKRILTFDNPRSVTLIKNIGKAKQAFVLDEAEEL